MSPHHYQMGTWSPPKSLPTHTLGRHQVRCRKSDPPASIRNRFAIQCFYLGVKEVVPPPCLLLRFLRNRNPPRGETEPRVTRYTGLEICNEFLRRIGIHGTGRSQPWHRSLPTLRSPGRWHRSLLTITTIHQGQCSASLQHRPSYLRVILLRSKTLS